MPNPAPAGNVRAFAPKPSTAYINVTPETAQRWLSGNLVNRKPRKARVNQYARDMREGRWNLSNDAICFGVDGLLLNGQHRLSAVVASGQTVLMLVARNMPSGAMTTMDTGSARTAGDALGFDGERNTALLAATLKWCVLVTTGRVYRDNRLQSVSHGELREFLERNPSVRDSVRVASHVRSRIDCPPSALATAHWLIAQAGEGTGAELYLEQLAYRSNVDEGSAVLAVDSRLRETRKKRTKYQPRNYIYLLLKGWNYWAEGKAVATLAMVPKKGTAFRIPHPARWIR